MSLVAPAIRPSFAASLNPLSKFGVALVVGVVLVLSIDLVSAGIVVGAILVVLPWSGLSARQLVLRTWPLLLSAVLAAIATALYGIDGGSVLLRLGPVTVTEGSTALAAAIFLRVLAVAVPAVVLFATTDPTDLADALGQRLHLPARFVLGALAGLRMVGLLVQDWRALELARRARGVAERGRARRLLSQSFTLLVFAIRRGGKLATAMEARGFGGERRRTWARPSRFRVRDAVFALVGITVVAVAAGTAIAVGAWNPVLG